MTKEIIEPVADTSTSTIETPKLGDSITPEPVVDAVVVPEPTDVVAEQVAQEHSEETKKESKGILDSVKDEAAKDEKDAEEYWKADWKEKIANGDEKTLKQLEKYKTPKDVFDAYKSLETEFSRTRPIKELSENPTPEEVTKYREEKGIPAKWEDYDTELGDGIVIGEDQKESVDRYLKLFHDKNLPNKEVKEILKAHFELESKDITALSERRAAEQKVATETLTKEWGNELKGNVNAITTYLDTAFSPDLSEALQGAVLGDGTSLQNNPELLNYFLGEAKRTMSSNTITPSGTSDYTSASARLAEITKIHDTNPKLYFNSPDIQKEAAELAAQLKK